MNHMSNIHHITRHISLGIGYAAVAHYALLEGIALEKDKEIFVLKNSVLLRGMNGTLDNTYKMLKILELWELISITKPHEFSRIDATNEYTILDRPKCTKKFFQNKMALMQHRGFISPMEAQNILKQFEQFTTKQERSKPKTFLDIPMEEWETVHFAQYIYHRAGIGGNPTYNYMSRMRGGLYPAFKGKGGKKEIKAYIDDIFDVFIPRRGITGDVSPDIVFAPKLQEGFIQKLMTTKITGNTTPKVTRDIPIFKSRIKRWTFTDEELKEYMFVEKSPYEQKNWEEQLVIEEGVLGCQSQYRVFG